MCFQYFNFSLWTNFDVSRRQFHTQYHDVANCVVFTKKMLMMMWWNAHSMMHKSVIVDRRRISKKYGYVQSSGCMPYTREWPDVSAPKMSTFKYVSDCTPSSFNANDFPGIRTRKSLWIIYMQRPAHMRLVTAAEIL